MHKRAVLSVLAISFLSVAPVMAADGGTLNDAERAFLIEQMEISKKAFLASIAGISEAQWTFKPAPNVWSVQECAEHIVLSETFLFDTTQQMLQSPAVARPEKSNAGTARSPRLQEGASAPKPSSTRGISRKPPLSRRR